LAFLHEVASFTSMATKYTYTTC